MAETYGGTGSGNEKERLQNLGTKWIERINAAEKREEEWRKDAEAAEKAFANDPKGTQGKVYDFNILHSNVETIVPAIFNSTPIPDIRRRFGDPEDMLAKQTGDVIERAITVLIDDSMLDREIEAGAQDAFLSGRDIIRLRFDADWQDAPVHDEITGEPSVDEDGEPVTEQVPQDERILFETVSWRDFRFGPARRWEHVPWVAFRHSIPQEELERISDKDMIAAQGTGGGANTPLLGKDDSDDVAVWEVWCKTTRKVKFIRENDRKVLSIKDDPLGLDGFFPLPPIVQPLTLTGKLTPICPFVIYKKLADELDQTTKRIAKVLSTLKVRGMTFGDAQDVQELARAGDGEIIVAQALEQLSQTGGLDGAIAWWPLEPAVKALQQLYLNRDTTRQAIYEITGISDIVRGASDARETLGAQEIKTQWGALRIQKMQRMVERQVRDVFLLMAEIIAKHFSPETLQRMTGIEITAEMQALLAEGPSRHYRIDVESDSTIRADMTRARGEMSEFLKGTAEFFGAVGPVVQEEPQLKEPLAEVYSSFARQFRLGKQAEDALDRMGQMAKQEQPEQPDPEQQKAQAEAEAKQAEMQLKAQQMQADQQAKQAEIQLKQQEQQFDGQVERDKLNIEREKLRQEAEFKAAELELKRAEMRQKAESDRESREAETKKQTAQTNESLGLPADFSVESLIEELRGERGQMAERDRQQSEAIERNSEAIRALAEAIGAPKEAILSDGRRIRVERDGDRINVQQKRAG